MIKVIRNDSEYEEALAAIEKHVDSDPDLDTPEADELEVLTLLVRDYEGKKHKIGLPDPVEAIKFRMEQMGFNQSDLVPFIGTRSKVSEVLSGKRTLTLSMIRALHTGLGIPAHVLLKERPADHLEESDINWERFPIREMIRRGWIKEKVLHPRDDSEDVLRRFFAPLDSPENLVALYRKTENIRSARTMDRYALTAWTARIMLLALETELEEEYSPESIDFEFMRNLAKQSWSDAGPLLAQEYLLKHGIPLIIEPHLPQTYLDGATIQMKPHRPVIGLTLRYDRIDNFWFTLMHEVAHLSLHIDNEENVQFYDDLDVGHQDDVREKEADELASETLIPHEVWTKSPASRIRAPEAVEQLADELGIHPAIVAGRVRHAYKSFRILNQYVGHRQVRKLFGTVDW